MKQANIYGITAVGALLCILAGAAAFRSVPDAEPESSAEQLMNAELIASSEAEITEETEPESVFADRNDEVYTYTERGKLIGLKMLADSADDALSEEQLLACSELYLGGIVKNPERYTLTDLEIREDGSCHTIWYAFCGSISTDDHTCMTVDKAGMLTDHSIYHIGEYQDVTVTEEQVDRAIELAVARASGDGEHRVTHVDDRERVKVTHDKLGTIGFEVGVGVEYQLKDSDSFEQGLTISSADKYFIPLDECI